MEGAHLALFFADHGFGRVVGHDFARPEEFDRSFKRFHVAWPAAEREAILARVRASVELRLGDRYLEGIEGAGAVAVGPGWDLYPANAVLHDSGIQARCFSLIQLYLALSPGPVVGVSGSQGKSTTSQLLGDMMEAAGLDVLYGGNYRHGRQCLDRLEHAGTATHLLLEISNRHLKLLRRSPNLSVLTNVYPNHLDEHGGWDGYVEAKSRMVRFQSTADAAVLNADLEVTRAMAGLGQGRKLWFGHAQPPGMPDAAGVAVRADGGIQSIGFGRMELAPGVLNLPGEHNLMNLAAAATAALELGAGLDAIEAAARKFRGLKHRVQFIWDAAGVRYYDDLNSSTPTATLAALRSIERPLVWILGGDDKGLDATDLAREARGHVRLALALPGAGTDRLVAQLEAEQVAVERLPDLARAVTRATEAARPGDAVLLSPACPGFFSHYYVGADEDTGFKHLVRQATLATSPPARTPPA